MKSKTRAEGWKEQLVRLHKQLGKARRCRDLYRIADLQDDIKTLIVLVRADYETRVPGFDRRIQDVSVHNFATLITTA